MADLSAVKAQVAALTEKVGNATTVDGSVVTLIQGMVGTLNDLKTQIAALSAGQVSQAELDEVAAQIGAQATALDQATGTLSAAVPANTPAADIPPTA